MVGGRQKPAHHQEYCSGIFEGCVNRKKENFAGCDDTASMIKGGGYVGAHTRQIPTAQNTRKISVGQGVCVPWHSDPHLDCHHLSCIAVHILLL